MLAGYEREAFRMPDDTVIGDKENLTPFRR